MEYLWQLRWLVYILTFVVGALIFTIGAATLWPPTWRTLSYDAAKLEIERRLKGRHTMSQAEIIAARRFLGTKPSDAYTSNEDQEALVRVIASMMGKESTSDISSEINDRRAKLAESALARQVHAVDNISSLTRASYVWKAHTLISEFTLVYQGLTWFLPRTITHLMKLYGKHTTKSTVCGAFLGFVFAYFNEQFLEGRPSSFLSIVGNFGIIALILSFTLSTLRLFRDLLIAAFEPTKRWNTRKAIFAGIFATVSLIFIYLSISGKFSTWSAAFGSRATTYLSQNIDEAKLGALFMIAAELYAAWNILKKVRMKELRLGDRVYSAACLSLLLVMIEMTVDILINIPQALQSFLFNTSVFMMFCTLILWAIVGIWERILEYRTIVANGRIVKRFGFRWWGVTVWLSCAAIQYALEYISMRSSLLSHLGNSQTQTVIFFSNTLSLLLTISFLPGIIITIFYFHRIHKTYKDLLFSQTPKHPLSTQDTDF